MTPTQIITNSFGVNTAQALYNELQSGIPYYVFVAKHTPYLDNSDQVIPPALDTVNSHINLYNQMIFGKKIQATEASLMITRYNWSPNTVFTQYDNNDLLLSQKNYYACVNVGSYTNVYKCLYNNANTASIAQPSGTDQRPFQTPQDGYVWQYIYTANSYIMSKFSTQDFVPISANTVLANVTVGGSLSVISVEQPGAGYNNYLNGAFGSYSDIKANGNPYSYSLGQNASLLNGFYTGCLIKITSGLAKNEHKVITNYQVSGGQRIITVDSAFIGSIAPTDTYEISPYVYVFDTGSKMKANCVARAIISPSGNGVSYIDILDAGSGYRAATAILNPDSSVAVTTPATLRPIISPPGGHGSDPYNELNAKNLSLAVKLIETEFTTLNDFRVVGVLKQPLFANVTINYSSIASIGGFTVGERVFGYKPTTLTGIAVCTGNNVVSGVLTNFNSALQVGDPVIVSNNTTSFYTSVSSIISDTIMTCAANTNITSSNCKVTLARNSTLVGVITDNTIGRMNVTNANPTALSAMTYIVGESSSCTSVIDPTLTSDQQILINGRAASGFNKFNQLTPYVGALQSGNTFILDEVVLQSNVGLEPAPVARIHSYATGNTGPNDSLFLTEIQGSFKSHFDVGSTGLITGQLSGAKFVMYDKYIGDLVPDSGDILYIENLNPISRTESKAETVKLLFKFN